MMSVAGVAPFNPSPRAGMEFEHGWSDRRPERHEGPCGVVSDAESCRQITTAGVLQSIHRKVLRGARDDLVVGVTTIGDDLERRGEGKVRP